MFQSKKVRMSTIAAMLASIVATVVPVILQAYEVEPDTAQAIVETLLWSIGILFGSYNVGQGLSDHGKERAKAYMNGALEVELEELDLPEFRTYTPQEGSTEVGSAASGPHQAQGGHQ